MTRHVILRRNWGNRYSPWHRDKLKAGESEADAPGAEGSGRRRGNMHSFIRILAGSLIVAGLGTAALAAPAPSDLEQQIQNPTLDVSHAVELRDFSIEMGGGVFEIDQGVLVPGSPISGRV